jgi:prevent-host-death family protein
MYSWPVQDAKARFSELVETCLRDGPQVVTRRGAEVAVLLPIEEWHRLRQSARRTLKDLLLSDEGPTEIPILARGGQMRGPPFRYD